eukprot:1157360-Pelagomonas_calceolata.AAC.9
MEVFGRLKVAPGMHLPVMAAVCCHGCALHRLLYVFQPHAPASAGFAIPECFECRPECTSWCISLTLPILYWHCV